MIKRLFLLTTLGVLLSGCFMVPMAFVGPAVSGFSTASIAQSAVTTGASYMVKKSTGKSIAEHAFDAIGGDVIIEKQAYFEQTDIQSLATRYSIKPALSTIFT